MRAAAAARACGEPAGGPTPGMAWRHGGSGYMVAQQMLELELREQCPGVTLEDVHCWALALHVCHLNRFLDQAKSASEPGVQEGAARMLRDCFLLTRSPIAGAAGYGYRLAPARRGVLNAAQQHGLQR
jgi:hypothetical protein